MEVTPLDNNVMATIIKLRNQHKRADLASIYKELTKNLELNKFTQDHLKNRINALLVNGKIIDKPNRDRPSYLLNENVSSTVDHVYEPELLETPLTPLNSPLSAPRLDGEIETPTIGQQHTCPFIVESELFLDTMLKKAHYTTFKNEIITELQKTVEGIFKSELEQFKVKSEKALSDSHIVYQEQIQSLKEACRTKDIMISKLLETIENLNSNKNYNHCNTTTTNKGYNNDSEIQRSKNTHLPPPQWDILSTSSDTTATSDNGRSIHVIPRISIEEQLREVRLQKGVQFKEYQRLHSETKKLEEKPDTYPPNNCVLMGDSILNGVIERNLLNDKSVKVKVKVKVKVRKFPGATVDHLRHHAPPIIPKQPKYLIIYAGTNDAVTFTSRDILNKLLQLKSFIQEKLPDAEIIVSTPTVRSDNGKAALTIRQLTNHLINLKIDILDNRNITGKHLSKRGLHLNQSGFNLLTKSIISKLRKF